MMLSMMSRVSNPVVRYVQLSSGNAPKLDFYRRWYRSQREWRRLRERRESTNPHE